MSKLFVHSPRLSLQHLKDIETQIDAQLNLQNGFYTAKTSVAKSKIAALSSGLKIDINLLPDNFKPEQVKLIISDMDSTLITIECIDEIADFANLKPEVAAITEAAMQGEIDFPESLRRRVSLLKGLKTKVLEKVYSKRLKLNLGAENLLAGLQAKSIKFALVSGGFTFFTSRLAKKLAIDFTKANVLGQNNGVLLGTVKGEIVDAGVKRQFLTEICSQMDIGLDQSIAIGDGANDLKMMNVAGLSVAYKAKQIVRQQSDVQINYAGLDLLLDFLN